MPKRGTRVHFPIYTHHLLTQGRITLLLLCHITEPESASEACPYFIYWSSGYMKTINEPFQNVTTRLDTLEKCTCRYWIEPQHCPQPNSEQVHDFLSRLFLISNSGNQREYGTGKCVRFMLFSYRLAADVAFLAWADGRATDFLLHLPPYLLRTSIRRDISTKCIRRATSKHTCWTTMTVEILNQSRMQLQ